ncbi:MAG: DUF2079 domain-containing protein [Acidimicrobiales bacterium]
MTDEVAARPARTVDGGGLLAAAVISAVVFVLSWLRHRNHWSGFDLAIFDQGSWQLSEGRSHISIVERHVLADHLSPVIYVFGWLYRLVATPAWLLGGQALALGVTVLPLRAIARHVGQPPGRATVLLVLSAPLLAAGLFDFHPSTLAVPFLAAAVLFALQDRPVAAAVAATAVALCRADLAPAILAIALVAAPRARWWLAGVGLASAGAAAVVPGRFGETTGWDTYFGHLGSGPLDAALHPWRVAEQLLSPDTLSVALLWVAAAGLIVVRRPRWLLAVAVAGLPVLLSQWEGTGLPWYHYGAPAAPIAVAGTLVALAAVPPMARSWERRARLAWWGAPLVVLLVASPLSPAAPESNRIWTVAFGTDGRDVDGALALVPAGVAVTADQRVLPHLSGREHAYIYPIPFAPAPDFFPAGSEPDLDAYGDDAVDVVVATEGHEDLVPAGRFEVVARLDGFVVFRRSAAGEDDDR